MNNESTNSIGESYNNIIIKLESSSTVIGELTTTLYNISNKNNELTNALGELKPTFIFDWIEAFNRENYSEIIYFLVENDACYLSGLDKILSVPYESIRHILRKLIDLKIVEPIFQAGKEKEIRVLRAHKRAFNLSDYHFQKITFYKLTDWGRAFFSGLPWDILIDKRTREKIKRYKNQLHQSHKEVEKEMESRDGLIEEYYRQYVKWRKASMDPSHQRGLIWIEKRAEKMEMDPEELLSKFERKYEERNRH
jgi:hypothetical protein